MKRLSKVGLVSVVMASLVVAACNNGDSSASTLPTVPSPTINEPPITGDLTVNGAANFPFAVVGATGGTVTATLSSLVNTVGGTAATIPIGLSLGIWNGTVCTVAIDNPKAIVGTSVIGSVTGPGSICVRVYDLGRLTGTVTFTLQVAHP